MFTKPEVPWTRTTLFERDEVFVPLRFPDHTLMYGYTDKGEFNYEVCVIRYTIFGKTYYLHASWDLVIEKLNRGDAIHV